MPPRISRPRELLELTRNRIFGDRTGDVGASFLGTSTNYFSCEARIMLVSFGITSGSIFGVGSTDSLDLFVSMTCF